MGRGYILRRDDLLFPELSFRVNGALFEVFKQIGGGHKEAYYQKAVAIALEKNSIAFVEQFYTPVVFEGNTIGKYYLDFLVEGKIVLELKRGQFIPAQCIQQTLQYLKNLELQLDLIACFTHTGVHIKRIINHTIS